MFVHIYNVFCALLVYSCGFIIGISQKAASYEIPKPSIEAKLHEIVGHRASKWRVRFICKIQPSGTEDLFYQVSWLKGGNAQFIALSTKVNSVAEFYLTEEQFVGNGFKLGENIACQVRPFVIDQGPPGKLSEASNELFAGIQILTLSLCFTQNEDDVSKRKILIQPTIPIGCEINKDCNLWLTSYIPSTCSELTIDNSACGVNIPSHNYSNIYSIPIKAVQGTGVYQTRDRIYEVYLKTDDIWKNYELPKIKVRVKPPTSHLFEGSICYARNDPHMKTFDGSLCYDSFCFTHAVRNHSKPNYIEPCFRDKKGARLCTETYKKYDNHRDGVYPLYKHTKYDTEVQIQHEMCNTRSTTTMCTCGVAFRAGRDVYRLSACNKKWKIGHTSCGDDAMTIKSNGEMKYKVYFNYGTYVDISIANQRFGGKNDGNRIVTVSVYPSHEDSGRASRGLCGTLDGYCSNDFHDKEGNYNDASLKNDKSCGNLNYKNQPSKFRNIWRISNSKDNLFNDNFDTTNIDLETFQVCVCENTTTATDGSQGTGGTVYIKNEIQCHHSTAANCTRGKHVGSHACVSLTRRRRSVINKQPVIPVIKLPESRNRRQAGEKNWTEAEATDFCHKYMGQSPVFSLCGEVPNAGPETSVDTCVMDIMMTGDTHWSSIAMETMQGACLSELQRNTTLSENTTDGKPSLARQIEEKACPNNCSAAGACVKGKCICEEGLGGADCSIDLSKGPTISGLLDNGLCDEQHLNCDHAYVFGHIFTDSSNLSCRLDEFSISENGIRSSSSRHYLKAEFETLVEVMCPIHHIRKRRSAVINGEHNEFVFGYTVSVSNDGNIYEEGKELFVYDSECQLVQNVNEQMHFTLKDGYCFIDNHCVVDGGYDLTDNCSACDTARSTRQWSFRNQNTDCLANNPEQRKATGDNDDNNYLWIIGVVAGVIAGATMAVIVVLKLTKNRAKKVGDSMVFDQTPKNSVTQINTDGAVMK